ncbi:cysteine--tRNA ligase [Desulfurivibrio alkaliphilus]|uniref:Cysteine--tRNA ligase n=1 Tax=Desulfurivibrio alkaliphilus (strain DSM 19089 / UNIQEM U267 / AHT2) TaxID=589865 RepID=D6Z0S2_DESAT|nr:cysteine--tRNA ligase [Desulfurivibrio alkaliphilus]ADH85301.1 cysteinyl-tRNA synthetase [Desulfurivibrio alkaliphilus AHT 2]
MPILIHNTKTARKEKLAPLEEGHVKMYVCGITAYDYCHIGHARSVLVFDMIYRYLQHRGYRVTFVRNFTDIDDKIIKRAQEQGTTCTELSQRFIAKFHEDMTALNTLPPTLEPLATEHLPEMIAMIEELVAKDLAYEAQGDVYYRVQRFAGYGVLSGRGLEDMQAGARVAVNDNKEHPMDFVLWKASKPGEPAWDSPWGPGRPGWHIECSAMGKKYLGETFDIHGGGKDLVFPHHENEIAQSEGASGKSFANLWVHHGFVTIKDEKMSKSLGNFLTIREVLERHPAEALRLFVFSTHYRNPLDYSETALQDAEAALTRIYSALAATAQLPGAAGDPSPSASVVGEKDRDKLAKLEQSFHQAMDIDFNSALALGRIFDAIKIINKVRQALPANPAPQDLQLLQQTAATIRDLTAVFGLAQEEPVSWLEKRQQRLLAQLSIKPAEIEALLEQREQARRDKDWAEADRIRDQLLQQRIVIKDGPDGTKWEVLQEQQS